MNELDRKLYELFDKFEDDELGNRQYGDEPTIVDLHVWLNDNRQWAKSQVLIIGNARILVEGNDRTGSYFSIEYDSSLPLLKQSDNTKQAIINLIESCNKQ